MPHEPKRLVLHAAEDRRTDPLVALGETDQALYVRSCLWDLDCRVIVEEPYYFDHDYLAEFGAFYGASARGYLNVCRRLTLFDSKVVDVATFSRHFDAALFADQGEVVFLVADEDEPRNLPDGQRNPAHHPWRVGIPIADSLSALERDLGEPALEEFRNRFAESLYPATLDGMKGISVLVGMFDAELPVDEASFDGETTRMDETAMGATLRRARIVSGEEFCTMDHQLGLVVEPDEQGNPVANWIVYRAPAGSPEWAAAIAMHVRPGMIEMTRFAMTVLETIRPIVQARTRGFSIPMLPNPEEVIDDVLKTLRKHLVGMRIHGGLVYPWDRVPRC